LFVDEVTVLTRRRKEMNEQRHRPLPSGLPDIHPV
jgi:hypothetical protein